MHEQSGKGQGNRIGEEYKPNGLAGEEQPYAENRRAEYFAYAYFPVALFGGIGSEAE